MKNLLVAALLTCPALAQAGNYATCLLDKLPGVQNQGATVSAVRVCQSEYPGGLAKVEQGAGRGLFASYDSGDKCTFEKAKDTRFPGAVRIISEACMRLYNKPQPTPRKPDLFDEFNIDPQSERAEKDCKGPNPGPWCAYR